MKVFVDTNVLVAAVATRGLCADVFRAVLASHELVVSQQVLDEVRRVLRVKLGVRPGPVADFVRLLEQEAEVAPPARLPEIELNDRDDLPILGGRDCGPGRGVRHGRPGAGGTGDRRGHAGRVAPPVLGGAEVESAAPRQGQIADSGRRDRRQGAFNT